RGGERKWLKSPRSIIPERHSDSRLVSSRTAGNPSRTPPLAHPFRGRPCRRPRSPSSHRFYSLLHNHSTQRFTVEHFSTAGGTAVSERVSGMGKEERNETDRSGGTRHRRVARDRPGLRAGAGAGGRGRRGQLSQPSGGSRGGRHRDPRDGPAGDGI